MPIQAHWKDDEFKQELGEEKLLSLAVRLGTCEACTFFSYLKRFFSERTEKKVLFRKDKKKATGASRYIYFHFSKNI